jgi:hypothetical protein
MISAPFDSIPAAGGVFLVTGTQPTSPQYPGSKSSVAFRQMVNAYSSKRNVIAGMMFG